MVGVKELFCRVVAGSALLFSFFVWARNRINRLRRVVSFRLIVAQLGRNDRDELYKAMLQKRDLRPLDNGCIMRQVSRYGKTQEDPTNRGMDNGGTSR